MLKLAPIFSLALVPFLCAQQVSSCELLSKGTDMAYISFERVCTEADLQVPENYIERSSLILRLRNNSSCTLEIVADEGNMFRVPLPTNPTISDRLNRSIVQDLEDGVFVPRVCFRTDDPIKKTVVRETSCGGCMRFPFHLLPGNSLLFAVPLDPLKKGRDILVPFNFSWETDGERPKYIESGHVSHYVTFRAGQLPSVDRAGRPAARHN